MASKVKIFQELNDAIIAYDEESAKKAAQKLVDEKADFFKAIKEMSDTMFEIGEKFHTGELFLPHLVMAADCMQAAADIIEPHLPKDKVEKQTLGTVVIGTVEGDLHDVGLSIVAMRLKTAGFKVYNLGKNVSVDQFISKAEQVNADIIAASALLSVARSKQRDLIEEVKDRGLPFKVMIGGGPVTREFAAQIGAHGFGEDSEEAVESAKEVIKKKKGGIK